MEKVHWLTGQAGFEYLLLSPVQLFTSLQCIPIKLAVSGLVLSRNFVFIDVETVSCQTSPLSVLLGS